MTGPRGTRSEVSALLAPAVKDDGRREMRLAGDADRIRRAARIGRVDAAVDAEPGGESREQREGRDHRDQHDESVHWGFVLLAMVPMPSLTEFGLAHYVK